MSAFRQTTLVVGFLMALGLSSAQALTLSDYAQDEPGRADGQLLIEDIDLSITELAVQIHIPNSPIDFELIPQDKAVRIQITDPQSRPDNTVMHIAVISDHTIINRSFVIEGQGEAIAAPAPAESVEPNRPDLTLEYAAITTTDAPVPDNAVQIDITESKPIRTVRDAIQFIVQGSNVRLLELPGDESVLDTIIDRDQAKSITSLNDLYRLSNARIGQIYLDAAKGIVRVVAKTPLNRRFIIPPAVLAKPGAPPKTPPNRETVRRIVKQLARALNLKLIELPGDERILDQSLELDEPITTLEQLHALPNRPISNVYVDRATQSLRVL